MSWGLVAFTCHKFQWRTLWNILKGRLWWNPLGGEFLGLGTGIIKSNSIGDNRKSILSSFSKLREPKKYQRVISRFGGSCRISLCVGIWPSLSEIELNPRYVRLSQTLANSTNSKLQFSVFFEFFQDFWVFWWLVQSYLV